MEDCFGDNVSVKFVFIFEMFGGYFFFLFFRLFIFFYFNLESDSDGDVIEDGCSF